MEAGREDTDTDRSSMDEWVEFQKQENRESLRERDVQDEREPDAGQGRG